MRKVKPGSKDGLVIAGKAHKSHDGLFRMLAPVYDYVIRPPEVGPLKALLQLPDGGRLLDLAGGTGRVSRHLVKSNTTVVVCDINTAMLRQAGRKQGLNPVLADGEGLPFPDNVFHGILVVDALHHFVRPRQMVPEMLRVLKPGGRLLIEEQDIKHRLIRLVSAAERAVGLHSRFLTSEEIVGLFDPARCRIHLKAGRLLTFRVLVKKRRK